MQAHTRPISASRTRLCLTSCVAALSVQVLLVSCAAGVRFSDLTPPDESLQLTEDVEIFDTIPSDVHDDAGVADIDIDARDATAPSDTIDEPDVVIDVGADSDSTDAVPASDAHDVDSAADAPSDIPTSDVPASDVPPEDATTDPVPPSRCGDGVVDDGESCDDGESNSDTEADACRTDCGDPRCGDGVLDSGEECEPSGAVECESDCTRIPLSFCGYCSGFPGCAEPLSCVTWTAWAELGGLDALCTSPCGEQVDGTPDPDTCPPIEGGSDCWESRGQHWCVPAVGTCRAWR